MLYNKIDKNLIPSEKFYSAHRRENKEFELLEAHSKLCCEYFMYLNDELNLESIIDKLILGIFGDRVKETKEIILYSIYYHDIGKINPNFQKARVRLEKNVEGHKEHSLFSERALASLLLKQYSDSKDIVYLVCNLVNNHHTSLHNFTTEDNNEDKNQKEIVRYILEEINLEAFTIDKAYKKDFFRNDDLDWSSLFLFIKLLYSLLVLSDSYSTIHYKYSFNEMYPLNTINPERINQMEDSFFMRSYNKCLEVEQIMAKEITGINDLRNKILRECDIRSKKLLKENKRIFMLPVPTGGGKTNISMKLALNILKHNNNIKRIFYVFPYINIIEQNSDVIKDTFFDSAIFQNPIGLVSSIYSRQYIKKFASISDEEEASNIQKNLLLTDDDYLNNCVNIITNVNFFNGIIKNDSDDRYKIANLCNSIVIIDEVQTLSDKNLRVFYDFIKTTSESLNIYYILMSATLPNFNYLVENVEVPTILENPGYYFNHPVFKRNKIIMKEKEVNNIDNLIKIVTDEINQNYKNGGVKILITMNLVKTSKKVYDKLQEYPEFKNFKFYLLNSTVSNLRRKEVIEELKDKKRVDDRIIIVSTQSIEAGVDIDCDVGIRDYATLDSIEQISGRINRECNPVKNEISKLYVIKYKDNEKPDCDKIYSSSERYKLMKCMDIDEILDVIECKNFDKYYKKVSNELKKIAKDNYDFVRRNIRELLYQEISYSINVIEKQIEKFDVFLCDKIPLNSLSKNDRVHIEEVMNSSIIKKFEGDDKIILDDKISTENLYNMWCKIMASTDRFDDKYIRRKITSLLNQFLISINNIKDHNSGYSLSDYFKKIGLIVYNDRFDVYKSTPGFLKYYSFTDGLKTDELISSFRVHGKSDLNII
jgi:CRISPR-associated endonuclease/helicase Cas3